MSQEWIYTLVFFAWLAGAAAFVLGLHLMNSPATARNGNRLSAGGMTVAVVATLIYLLTRSGGISGIGIAIILPRGRAQLFLAPGDPATMLPVMLLFSGVAVLNGMVLAFLRYRAILPLPNQLLFSRLAGAAANAFAEELQFRSIVLGLMLFGGLPTGVALILQALLYGLAHRRLWDERDWYFLAGSVLLGYGTQIVNTGQQLAVPGGGFADRGEHVPVRGADQAG